ncbi:MAG: hypothetical protein MJ107_02790 [Lachnospiraceae bacterium]|nr:hypothetical protein [Lachnospiraceae bacterium]
MIFLLIAVLIAVPYILGTALTIIFGDRSTRGNIRWVIGILFCLAYFFGCLLISLRLDSDLAALCKLFAIFTASFVVGSIPVVIFGFSKNKVRVLHYDKKILTWLIPGILLGLFSIFALKSDYSNDITLETINTTLLSGKLYEYSSLLGTKAEVGYPIFNKLEILPMLYACLAKMFRVEAGFIVGCTAPVISYISNLFIMWEVATLLVKDKHKNLFMIFHLLILIAGTYLPTTAIPVTVGQPLLRQGYSGYAFAYGVLIPAMVLVLLQKRYTLAGMFLIPLLGLVKLDRIFFAFKVFFTSYELTNYAGKLFVLYYMAVIWWIIRRKNKVYVKRATLLSGSALICTTLVDMYEYFEEKKTFPVFAGFLILACCSFMPYKGAEFAFGKGFNYEELLADKEQVTIWAPEPIMEAARRENAKILPVYGRDLYSDLLRGTNYEEYHDEEFLVYAMDVISRQLYHDFYIEDLLVPNLSSNTSLNKVDVIVLRTATLSVPFNDALFERGFEYWKQSGEYTYLRRTENEIWQ